MTKRSEFIFNELGKLFPSAHCELEYHNHYELLIMVILSAQTTDKKVNNVSKVLFNKYKNFDELKDASFNDVYEIIKPLGLAKGKTNNIINLSKKIISSYGGVIPKDFDELVSLNGVGRKTANVFLSEAYKENRLAVDTHVARCAFRLNLTDSSDPVKVEKDLVREFNGVPLHTLHHLLIFFGRYKCKSQKPDCQDCPFIEFCREKNHE